MLNQKLTGQQAADKTYIEDVFSTYLYTGTGASQTITNGIDLAGKGGLVWCKGRSNVTSPGLVDTARGATYVLGSNSTAAQGSVADTLTSFNSNGFSVGADTSTSRFNTSGYTYASWTFRKAPKFFDVVTYTGDGVSGRTISHSLGQVPGMVIVKRTNATLNWSVWHRSFSSIADVIKLNLTGAVVQDGTAPFTSAPTDSLLTLGSGGSSNISGGAYVAYLFAHDTTTDGLIQCGSYTGNGSTTGPEINLGWEPQYLLVKNASATGSWLIYDTMRSWKNDGTDNFGLIANTTDAEAGLYKSYPTQTGFTIADSNFNVNTSGNTYIYMAIRRGPMRTPTDATKVFYPQVVAQTDIQQTSNSPLYPDLIIDSSRNGSTSIFRDNVGTRLIGLGSPNDTFSTLNPILYTNSTSAESSTNGYIQLKADSKNVTKGPGWNNASYGNFIYWLFSRAPGFFDVVCYTGNGVGTNQAVNHSLGVKPELVIIKSRSTAQNWPVAALSSGSSYWSGGNLNGTVAFNTPSSFLMNSTTFATNIGASQAEVNASGVSYIAYLFASCPGVSKVGSYTGNGSSQTINCGFTNGARFVLIKRTNSTGDWYVWDTARGIVAGNDPRLSLNSTAVEVTTDDTIDPDSTGFIVNQVAATNVNVSGGSYIYLAIA